MSPEGHINIIAAHKGWPYIYNKHLDIPPFWEKYPKKDWIKIKNNIGDDIKAFLSWSVFKTNKNGLFLEYTEVK